jgi:hypothetical protein
MPRSHDWPERLHRIIESAAELSFEWGRFDCALHVCNCIRALIDVDPAADYRGKYSDAAGAAKIYGESFEQFIAATCAKLNFEEVPVTFARRGDVVFLDNDSPQGAIGVVSTDGRFASCASDKGLVLLPIQRWKRAWKVD